MKQTKSRHKIAQMFDQIAVEYDRTNRYLSLGQDFRWRKSLKKYLPQKESLVVVDLACGTGNQIAAIDQPNIKFYGIDISKEMLKIAKKKLGDNDRIELMIGSALQIPLDDEVADAVTISFGIRNVSDPARCLMEILRVLKPGGRILILEFSIPQSNFVRFFSDFYVHKIVPWMGKKITKKQLPYTYLSDTIEEFYSGESFVQLMEDNGFIHTSQKTMNFGTVSLYIGEKPQHNR